MSARPGALGATRVCPHCRATVLQSASICPGCQHHLRFSAGNAEPESKGVSAMRIEGSIHHAVRDESCEYCVVISITNERGEKVAGERHKYTFSVDLMPSRGVGGERRRN